MEYYLKVYDNFNYMDENEAYITGSFNTGYDALNEAQRMVKDEILNLLTTGTKPKDLLDSWFSFGEDPVILCSDPIIKPPFFSARNYAEEVVKMLEASLLDDRENIQTIYQDTIMFAAEKHVAKNQLVPGTNLPYAVHLSNVCMEIFITEKHTAGFNLKVAIQSALLHDTLEDTDTTEQELEAKFGIAVATCLKALTKNSRLPKDHQMDDSLDRIIRMSLEVWAVKLADRIANLQAPPPHWDHRKIDRYIQEAELILEKLKGGNSYLENRLRKRIEVYETYLGQTYVFRY